MLTITSFIALVLLKLSGSVDVTELDLNSFSADVIADECESSDSECIANWKDLVLSTKLATYYRRVYAVNDAIANGLGNVNWTLEEGGSLGYHKKTILLSLLADDKRVKTICEIGFNSGHSAVNFLTSNPSATLISFDLFHYPYTPFAVNHISDVLFPDRSLFLVPGNTTESIPEFVSALSVTNTISYGSPSRNFTLKSETKTTASYPLCNLIFIDGGHTREVTRSDLLNMKLLADPEYHIVIVDDYDMEQIKEVVAELESQGVVKDLLVYDDIQIHRKIEYEYDPTQRRWKFILSPDLYPDVGEVVTLKYV